MRKNQVSIEIYKFENNLICDEWEDINKPKTYRNKYLNAKERYSIYTDSNDFYEALFSAFYELEGINYNIENKPNKDKLYIKLILKINRFGLDVSCDDLQEINVSEESYSLDECMIKGFYKALNIFNEYNKFPKFGVRRSTIWEKCEIGDTGIINWCPIKTKEF